jgi:hypothetical protein
MVNMNEGYNKVLGTTQKIFESAGVSVMGQGFVDVATRKDLFDQYNTALCSGIQDPNDQANVHSLIENSNREILSESSISGLSPISSLVGPVIRKLWPKFTLRQAVNTSVAQQPVVTLNWTRPYIEKADATGRPVRTYLPRGLRDSEADDGSFEDIEDMAGNTKTITVDLKAGTGVADFWALDDAAKGTSLIKYQPIDPVVALASITFVAKDAETKLYTDAAATVLATASDLTMTVEKFTGIDSNLYYSFKKTFYTAADTAATLDATILVQAQTEEYQEKSQVKDGKIIVALISKTATDAFTVSATIRAKYSTEYNENSVTVGTDVERKDIKIGTGEHINANFPVEQIRDMSSLYSLDSVALVTDAITKIFAAKVDTKIYKLIKNSFLRQPGNIDEFEAYPDATKRVAQWDVKPMVGYAGDPLAWQNSLKPVIDHIATRIKTDTYLDDGIFTIIGNPLDMILLNTVEWQFTSGGAADGVAVDYSLGIYKGLYTYRAIASPLVPEGWLYISFIPTTVDQRTLDYWAYSYSIEAGYRDPNRQNVPSIMVTKRDTVHEFMPAVGAVKILNNKGDYSYDPFRDVLPVYQTAAAGAGNSGEIDNSGVLN